MKKILLAALLPLGLCACASMSEVAYDDDSMDQQDARVVPGSAFKPASSFAPASGVPAGMSDARIFMDGPSPNIQQMAAPRGPWH